MSTALTLILRLTDKSNSATDFSSGTLPVVFDSFWQQAAAVVLCVHLLVLSGWPFCRAERREKNNKETEG
jgi:hypothetical protein